MHALSLLRLAMSLGSRAILISFVVASEPTVLVVRLNCFGGDAIPLIDHDLLNVLHRERPVLPARLLPIVRERVVEWAEPLCSVGRHEEDAADAFRAAIVEGLEHSLGIVDVGFVDDESERVAIQTFNCLRKGIIDQLQKHFLIHSSYSSITPLIWCINLRQQRLRSSAAGDHIESLGVAAGLCGEDVGLLAWKDES